MFITDDKLPDDVVRKQYAETKHALCCLNCGFEYGFDPTQPGSIGKPLWFLLEPPVRSLIYGNVEGVGAKGRSM